MRTSRSPAVPVAAQRLSHRRADRSNDEHRTSAGCARLCRAPTRSRLIRTGERTSSAWSIVHPWPACPVAPWPRASFDHEQAAVRRQDATSLAQTLLDVVPVMHGRDRHSTAGRRIGQGECLRDAARPGDTIVARGDGAGQREHDRRGIDARRPARRGADRFADGGARAATDVDDVVLVVTSARSAANRATAPRPHSMLRPATKPNAPAKPGWPAWWLGITRSRFRRPSWRASFGKELTDGQSDFVNVHDRRSVGNALACDPWPKQAATRRQPPDVRREQLLDAAQQVLLERGLRAATVADVAEAAGVAKGTMYLYYESKDDLLAGLRSRYLDQYAEALRSSPGKSASERIRQMIMGLFEFAAGHTNCTTCCSTKPASARKTPSRACAARLDRPHHRGRRDG